MKVALISLGCSKNLVDSEIMLGFLKKAGFEIKADANGADIAIINTCAFIKEAKQEAIDEIFHLIELKKKKKLRKIIVAGCLPQRYAQDLPELLKEVDGFVGPGSIDKIISVIKKADNNNFKLITAENHYLYKHTTPRQSLTPSHYAYVKIADGCDNRCTYCVIPQIRGAYRSRTIESITAEVKLLVKKGVKEINLISQDSTFYGQDIYQKFSLDLLLKQLVKIKGDFWIRILYSHPLHFNKTLLDTIKAEPKICKYIDLPIQHINDKILKLMGRKVSKQQIKSLIKQIRAKLPDVALRTSLIVGFPQESEANFKELYDFVKTAEFERLGVFAYSQEENTLAAKLKGQIPEKIKQRRLKKIMTLQQEIIIKKHNALIGREIDVLIEEVPEKNLAAGRSQFDAPDVDGLIYVNGENLQPGDMVKVKITDSMVYDLIGDKQ
ncbi:MAG: 30S ribosomal protein S12 methylthiotransferase RimO [Candidatus Omnitrophica bacterium]|nr:30S ribosomal protein S12 methylthiotransferase RimO [Candidatus Omnitrophota bacterium]